ncbi:MAG TPA: glycoside hydrolase family 19 protein [Pyrinomonadaceae bacterium]
MTITQDQLRRIMPGANSARLALFLPHLQAAMDEFQINTPLRAAAFLAQLAHESGQLRFMEEIWGPTSAQRRYEPVTSLSRTLGNTVTGDGFRFKGRGPIQLTGRANYQRFGGLLGLDLVGNPSLAATPEVAFRIAALFWQNRGLNAFADTGNFREITRRINGGFNGLADRVNFYNRAKAILGVGSAAGPAGASRAGASRPSGRAGASPGRAGASPGRAGAGAEDGGLSRGIMPGDPKHARMLSEGGAKAGAKAGAKKAGAKKAGARKAAGKKAGAKKAAAKKGGAKKAVAKKAVAKKAGTKKGAAGKGGAGATKGAAKKTGARKGAASAKKSGAKKRR